MRTIATLFFVATTLAAQTHTVRQRPASRANADQLGLTCTQMLETTSTAWVAKFTAEKGAEPAETIRAISAYGKCYDARTDQLAARLKKTGKGPLMGARGNFQSVEQALKVFAAKALADSDPPADAVKSAYASLYEKQFRYEFYDYYEPKPPAPQALSPGAKQAPGPVSPKSSGAASTAGTPQPQQATDPNSQRDANAKSKNEDVDPLTAAKNHFGELLGDLPDEHMHDLHKAFGEILGPNSATPRMQLLIYRYAIFLLEPAGGTPFSPAPF